MAIQIQEIKKMIYEAYPKLSGVAKTYVEALDNVVTLYTNTVEEIIHRQCAYIYLNLIPEPDNKQQKLVKQRLFDMSQGRKPRETLGEVPTDMLTEEEASEIMIIFEKETFHKLEKGEKITLDDYVNFARKYGYSIGKVLVASAWLDEHLSNKAIEARNVAYEEITFA